MKIYIVLECPEAMGADPKNPNDLVLGVFLDQKRAEDFVRGIISYIYSYEERRLFLVQGKAQDAEGTPHFQILDMDAVC